MCTNKPHIHNMNQLLNIRRGINLPIIIDNNLLPRIKVKRISGIIGTHIDTLTLKSGIQPKSLTKIGSRMNQNTPDPIRLGGFV